MALGLLMAILLPLTVFATTVSADPVVVYTSGSHVGTWNEINADAARDGMTPHATTPAAYANWPDVCVPEPAVGLDANWVTPHSASQFGLSAHPWQPGAGFSAQWINA